MMTINPDQFFREVTLRISSSLDVDEAMDNLYGFLRGIFPLDGAFLSYMEPDGALYNVSRVGDLSEAFAQDRNIPITLIDPTKRNRLEKEAERLGIKTGDVVLMNYPWPSFFKDQMSELPILSLGPLSIIVLRLGIQNEILGEFGLLRQAPQAFIPEHVRLLQTIREPMSIAMSNARRYRELLRLRDILADDNRSMRMELERISGNQVIGAEFGLRETMNSVRQVAPLNSPILLLGETGTGKEVIANAIHLASPRRDKPMVRVQCGAIPDTLLDSELFGHEKGAFTGALGTKRGRFERANGGTIFLDEIGELTLDAQVKLLRVLQEQEIERLGGTQTIKVDVRVIAATHRDLEQMVRRGNFREDLWYRLNVFPIHLPPLRERKEDIWPLAAYFLNRKAREIGLADSPHLAPEALSQLKAYDWPGNVRELQNVLERALIVRKGAPLSFPNLEDMNTPVHLPGEGTPHGPLPPSRQDVKPLDEMIAEHIRRALHTTRGQVEGKRGAAAVLKINPSTLRAKMRRLSIPFGRDCEDF